MVMQLSKKVSTVTLGIKGFLPVCRLLGVELHVFLGLGDVWW
jgi:hypothetical protein